MSAAMGMVHVYTGDGKGKTTAAMGLALRAAGHGFEVRVLQFLKGKGTGEVRAAAGIAGLQVEQVAPPVLVAHTGEIDPATLRELDDQVTVFAPGQPPPWLVEEVGRGLAVARRCLSGAGCDLLVLDELNVVLHFGLADEAEVLRLIQQRRPGVEVVVTGRNAPPRLLELADLVTEMVQRKHYFTAGVRARRGIEF